MSIAFEPVGKEITKVENWLADASDQDVIRYSSFPFLTPVVLAKITKTFVSLPQFLQANEKKLQATGISAEYIKIFKTDVFDIKEQLLLLKKYDIRLVRITDPEYPELLRQIADPPLWLYVRGQLPKKETSTLTVVGTRRPSSYALSAMQMLFTKPLLEKVTIVSGLAYGVDKSIHQLSLSAGGTTIAVLAGGLDVIYPAAHISIAREILGTGGALISEYPPLSHPEPYRFPIRNRIIAGLSPLTIIIEATIKSGTLTTARAAVDYNRDVMALPGDISRLQAEGPNYLIKNGAFPITASEDLLEYYHIKSSKKPQVVDKVAQKILDLLADSPKTADEIAAVLGVKVTDVLTLITGLELAGHIFSAGGVYNIVRR